MRNETHIMIVSLFAGPGGACEGIRQATGQHPIGIERNPDAVATRDAAGHISLVADLTTMTPCDLDCDIDGLWASPPCPAFSAAGNREGHADLEHLCWLAARHNTWGPVCAPGGWTHPDSQLIVNTLWWVKTHRPRWVAFEQVPAVLPVWEATCRGLEQLGYSTWAGVLCAADWGVPQTRRRAFLMASLDRLVQPPVSTHCEGGGVTLWGEFAPWVSMADALGWVGKVGFPRKDDTGTSPDGYRERDWFDTDGPAPSVTEKARSWVLTRPATTVQGDARIAPPGHRDRAGGERQFTDGTVRCTPGELAALQGFPDRYPFQGSASSQFQQIGNAVPPPMARAIVEALI
jgi:DNA (cytosine-5)-methyltransferase 1